MSPYSNPAHIQELSLDGINAIEIQSERLDLVIEADPEVEGVARLLAEASADAPEFTRRGDRLRISQDGRYRGASPLVLKLPPVDLPTLGINLERGNLSVENLATKLGINIGSGNLSLSGGDGDAAINIANGNVAVRAREGDLACRVESGNIDLQQCNGDIALSVAKGNVTTRGCAGNMAVNIEKGEMIIARPVEQHLRARNTRGNVTIQGGSLKSADVEIVRGDIHSSARLLFTAPAEAVEEFDDVGIDELDDLEAALEDVATAAEEVRFNLGSLEFIAGEAGVRVSTGGTERFHAGPQGLVIRGRDGKPIFMASEQGIITGSATRRRRDEQFRFATTRGNIMLDISEDQPARVELIVNRGTVQSDIPLVEVGRPGPRSTTRRYVGVSDSSETERILIRARTNRGDIRVRTHDAPREPVRQARPGERERKRRAILEALAQGKLTTDEADILLAALERDTS
ncbi:MAG TPA: hypothetical protein VKZ96_12420 [Thermomicrobiales bacterium]|nr:hypothetical protein [Thermomicrobiales bacterium]